MHRGRTGAVLSRLARKVAFEDELAGLLEEWQGAADEEERNVILDDIESAQKAISTIARLLDLGE